MLFKSYSNYVTAYKVDLNKHTQLLVLDNHEYFRLAVIDIFNVLTKQ